MARAIPEGYHSVTPYLIIAGAAKALDFYKQAFGATEVMRMQDPKGRIGHAEIKIGDSRIMLADEYPEMGYRGPTSLGGAASHSCFTSTTRMRRSSRPCAPAPRSCSR
jgi:PhnB protein